MARWLNLIMLMAALSGCQGQYPSEDQMDAMSACLDRWKAEYPDIYDPTERENGGFQKLGVIEFDEVSFDQHGYFFIEQPYPKDRAEMLSHQGLDRLTCRGNLEHRSIEFVGWNDVIKRPLNKIVWSF